MGQEQNGQIEDTFRPTWYGEQDENGVDLSLIRRLLKMTPVERARAGDRARSDALRLQELGRQAREKPTRRDR